RCGFAGGPVIDASTRTAAAGGGVAGTPKLNGSTTGASETLAAGGGVNPATLAPRYLITSSATKTFGGALAGFGPLPIFTSAVSPGATRSVEVDAPKNPLDVALALPNVKAS